MKMQPVTLVLYTKETSVLRLNELHITQHWHLEDITVITDNVLESIDDNIIKVNNVLTAVTSTHKVLQTILITGNHFHNSEQMQI